MVLFIEDGAPVIVQGMTGHQGMTHTARMLKAGTNIVGGVNARKAGLDGKLWQRGYYEHVIRNEQDYRETWEYIDGNPARWLDKHGLS